MYKTKLQELCQKKSWDLPTYETTKEGPPHNPRFSTTVTVNSTPFTTREALTLKLSQNEAAMLAFNLLSQQQNPSFSSFPEPAFSTSSRYQGIMYKNKLQTYAQQKNLKLPVYSSEQEGPPHAMLFRCNVTVDGRTFKSCRWCSTLKEAEHAAAAFALTSLSPDGVKEEEDSVYKNLLQELVQKEGSQLPDYSTSKFGPCHMPIFISQVNVKGETFTGEESKSKKQAEKSAAKVAYTTLIGRKALGGQPPNRSKANVITDLQQHCNGESSVSTGLGIQNPLENDNVTLETTDLTFEAEPTQIVDRNVKILRNRDIPVVSVAKTKRQMKRKIRN